MVRSDYFNNFYFFIYLFLVYYRDSSGIPRMKKSTEYENVKFKVKGNFQSFKF